MADLVKKAGEGMAKLHGLRRGIGDSGLIDAPEGVIPNESVPAVMLGDAAGRRRAEVGQGLGYTVGEDGKESTVGKVGKLIADKGTVGGG